jgi:YEATS domain-containing protein 4
VCSAFWQGKNIPDSQHSHKWTVYLRGLENEDLSYFIEKVSFTLHHSFAEPVRGSSRCECLCVEFSAGLMH